MKRNNDKNSMFYLALLSILTVTMIAIVFITKTRNKITVTDSADSIDYVNNTVESVKQNETFLDPSIEKWQEGVIEYNGEKYKYNDRLKVYLLMGIDKKGVVEEAQNYTSGGQSDANFLLVVDTENMKLSVVSINRNIMTDIVVYTEYGDELGTMPQQLCLQHAYGDGKKLSCNLSVNAVSKLFYNVPIDGYIAINMGAIPMLNDYVGGVEVEVLPGADGFNEGDVVTLHGEEAYQYIRNRDINEFNSASYRQKRHEQYINAYFKKLEQMQDNGLGMSGIPALYNSIADYMVSSVDFVTFVQELFLYNYDENNMYIVPGEMQQGEVWEEYIVDQDEFYDLIMEVFYNKVE